MTIARDLEFYSEKNYICPECGKPALTYYHQIRSFVCSCGNREDAMTCGNLHVHDDEYKARKQEVFPIKELIKIKSPTATDASYRCKKCVEKAANLEPYVDKN
jgi:hypothetical protein